MIQRIETKISLIEISYQPKNSKQGHKIAQLPKGKDLTAYLIAHLSLL